MEVRALIGRFVWRVDGTNNCLGWFLGAIKVSGFKPTLKVCERNRVAHALIAPDKGHLLEELGWITCVAWKKQQKGEKKREEKDKAQRTAVKAQRTEAQSSMTLTSSDLAGLLISIGKTVLREESAQSKDFEEGK